jgi:hypothetical protein
MPHLPQSPNVSGYFKMNFFKKIFGKTKAASNSLDNFNDFETISVEDFSKLSSDNRIIAIMKLGDRDEVNINHFKLFQFAILSDLDKDVKFAVLKRIHLFKGHSDLLPMMNKLREENNYKNLEPYFSMALSRLGLISLDDFKQIINKS